MLSQEQIDGFRKDGFLNCGNVLSEKETAELRDALQRVVDGRSEAKPEGKTFPTVMEAGKLQSP